MSKVSRLFLPAALLAAVAMTGCQEAPQTAGRQAGGATPAAAGTDNGYAAPGWKAGDSASWANQIQERTQRQNEYVRTGGMRGH